MERVFIDSIGFTKVGDHWEKSLLDLAFEAGSKALAGSQERMPDALIVANMFSAISSKQENLGPLVADALGMRANKVPAVKVENGSASGAAAVLVASSLIRSGDANSVLVVGVEKMRDLEPADANLALSLSESAEYTQFLGAPQSALAAMLARLYMYEFSVTRDMLSSLPVLAHRNASSAPHAQFRKPIAPEDVARSANVSDPLKILDCAPVGDGAAAVVLSSGRLGTKKESGKGVEVAASAMSTQEPAVYEREDMLEFKATRAAAEAALNKARVSVSEISFFEIHDSYSIVGALSLEGVGLSRKGEGAKEALAGRFDLVGGEAPINTFGGLKGRGHPIGATGLYQICEAWMQLTSSAGPNSVNGAEVGLTQSCSGIDSSCVVHVLRRA